MKECGRNTLATCGRLKRLAIAVNAILLGLTLLGAQAESAPLSGRVTDMSLAPVVGASVTLESNGVTLTGLATDSLGTFEIFWHELSDLPLAELDLRVSSIGFQTELFSLQSLPDGLQNDEELLLALTREEITIEAVEVTARGELEEVVRHSAAEIRTQSQRSFMASNPLESVRGESVSRSGSAFGSQVILHGSAPDYTLNGVTLGSDPNHFGMFAFLPTSALDEVSFSSHTAGAAEGSPAVVDLSSDRNFRDNNSAELTLSALEAVATIRRGNTKRFLSATLRKSVLDRLIKYIGPTGKRATIPPTNFQDVFVTGGLRVSPNTSVFLDQYVARDHLAFNTEATALNSAGVETLQQTDRQFINLEMRRVTRGSFWRTYLSMRQVSSTYGAIAQDSENPGTLSLNLHEDEKILRAGTEVTLPLGQRQIKVGVSGSVHDSPETSVQQQNWNFLPPYSPSDNPHYFQEELNQRYGDLTVAVYARELDMFAEIETRMGAWKVKAGLRGQAYDYLANDYDALWRLTGIGAITTDGELRLSAGSYAESPLADLLQPYQILIRHRLQTLRSVKTKMASANYSHRLSGGGGTLSVLRTGVFAKRVSDVPALSPTFSADGIEITDLRMESNATRTFYGLSASLQTENALAGFLGKGLQTRISYAFNAASATVDGMGVSYSEYAPHSFELDVNRQSGVWSYGALMTARTGYRYTAPVTAEQLTSLTTSASEFYQRSLDSEGAMRFPSHVNVSLSISRKSGGLTTFASVGNILNRGNPIVSAHDGFIYDAGILPSLGVNYRF